MLLVALMSHAAGGIVCGASGHMFIPDRCLANLDMYFILDVRCRDWPVRDLYLQE